MKNDFLKIFRLNDEKNWKHEETTNRQRHELFTIIYYNLRRQLLPIWSRGLESISSSVLYSLGEIFIAKSKAFAVSPEFYLQFTVSIQTNKWTNK